MSSTKEFLTSTYNASQKKPFQCKELEIIMFCETRIFKSVTLEMMNELKPFRGIKINGIFSLFFFFGFSA